MVHVILSVVEDYPKGESRDRACSGMTEPKGRGYSPIQ